MNNSDQCAAEERRVSVLRQYAILDTPREAAFEELVLLAAQVCQAPMAQIAFIDQSRQWNKAATGWDAREIPREDSIAAAGLDIGELVVIEDASSDVRFCANRFVTGPPKIRFYAGAPLTAPIGIEHPFGDGGNVVIGMLCVMASSPRTLTPDQAQALSILAKQVSTQLKLRRGFAELSEEHSKTQAALKHSESFYHSLVETLPQNIFRKDLEGRFTFANSKFCATLNRPLDEILGKTDFDLFPSELALKYQKDDSRVIHSGKPLRAGEKHQTNEGSTLYVQVIKTALYDASGKICGIQGIFWDETERYKTQEILAHERALFRAMLDNIPDSIYFKDRESRFIAISRSLATRLGLNDPEEIVGRRDLDFFSPGHARQAFEDEQLILQTGEPIVAKTEKEVVLNGKESWVLTTKVPLKDSTGAIIGTFGISKDITDFKAAEAELAMARDAALESARLKSEFLANMSHEIRTPLNAVIGMAGLLMDTALSEEQIEFSETIRSSADTLLGIINDILDFSKIEAGKLAIEIIDFDLAEVVEGTAELLAEAAQKKGVELASWIHETLPRRLRGDPGRVRQILTNLVSNAVKFTSKGEVVINVTRERENDQSVVLRFAVRDTGIGISYGAQSSIFQAFTQADGSTTRRYGGTGLGLAICKQLVELMQGQIGFDSVPGQGSTFWFTLPFEKQLVQTFVPAMASTLDGLKVLIVDDNHTNLEILHRQLLSWRIRSGCAETASQCLTLLRQAAASGEPYNLAILDMQMPAMDGLELAMAIKKNPDISSIRLIMLTSVGQLPDEHHWRDYGIEAYLIKPVKELRLYDTLVSVMRGSVLLPSRQRHTDFYDESSPDTKELKHSMRVLVAEDNIVNQKVALRQLQKLGYSADAVANGFEVLQALEQIPYDVILMDCQMPELDGYETARRIRLDESRGRLKGSDKHQYIVAMTANALAGDREECLAAGMNDYISKPVRIDELRSALTRGMEDLRARRNNPQSSRLTGPILDEDILQSLRDLRTPGEPDPLAELADLFIADTPGRIDRIEAALTANDLGAIETSCHTLKGSASNLGANRLAGLCASLITQARDGKIQDRAAHGAIRAEFERVETALLEAKTK